MLRLIAIIFILVPTLALAAPDRCGQPSLAEHATQAKAVEEAMADDLSWAGANNLPAGAEGFASRAAEHIKALGQDAPSQKLEMAKHYYFSLCQALATRGMSEEALNVILSSLAKAFGAHGLDVGVPGTQTAHEQEKAGESPTPAETAKSEEAVPAPAEPAKLESAPQQTVAAEPPAAPASYTDPAAPPAAAKPESAPRAIATAKSPAVAAPAPAPEAVPVPPPAAAKPEATFHSEPAPQLAEAPPPAPSAPRPEIAPSAAPQTPNEKAEEKTAADEATPVPDKAAKPFANERLANPVADNAASPGPKTPEAKTEAPASPVPAHPVGMDTGTEAGAEGPRLTGVEAPSAAPGMVLAVPASPKPTESVSEECQALGVLENCTDFSAYIAHLKEKPLEYNHPRTMFLGRKTEISLVLRTDWKGKDMPAEPAPEMRGLEGSIEQGSSKVTQIMSARLSGADFDIDPAGQQERLVTTSAPVVWNWLVTPNETGHAKHLKLELYAHIHSGGETKPPVLIKTLDATIDVDVKTWDWILSQTRAIEPIYGILATLIGVLTAAFTFLYRRAISASRSSEAAAEHTATAPRTGDHGTAGAANLEGSETGWMPGGAITPAKGSSLAHRPWQALAKTDKKAS